MRRVPLNIYRYGKKKDPIHVGKDTPPMRTNTVDNLETTSQITHNLKAVIDTFIEFLKG